MTLRLAYMTGEYPRATDTFIQREVAALRAAGHTVETLSIRRPAGNEAVSDAVRAERDRTYYVLSAGWRHLLSSHFSLMFRRPADYWTAIKLASRLRPPGLKATIRQAAYFGEAAVVARRLRDRNIRHLHNHFANSSCSVAAIASAMGGFTYSITMHGPAEFFEPKYWQIGTKIDRAAFVACISHFCRSQAMVFAPPRAWPRMHVVHCGVIPEDYGPPGFSDAPRLLFVGRLAAVKGLPVLIEAMSAIVAKHPKATLTVVGDGPDRATLEQAAAGLPVSFLGYRSAEEVRDLLRQTDLFVMASFAEGVPVVLMEAMASGLPVVATRIAGVPELVVDGVSGRLVPPGDADALAAAVIELLGDPDRRRRMGEAGNAMVRREFDVRVEAEKLMGLFGSVLTQTNGTDKSG